MKLGVVDVGGGLRGIYAAGVLDYCIDQGIQFDCCIGVSAGSANLISFMAGQRGRCKLFYTEYAFRKQYMGIGNFLRSGSYIGLEYVYGVLSNSGGENPLNYQAFRSNPAEYYAVAENAVTGEAKYFSKKDIHQDDYRGLMASSCIPGVDKPYVINGVPYFDGALADPVPIRKAFELGCDKVVLILTKPASVPRKPGKDLQLAKLIRRRYPVSSKKIANRAKAYNTSVKYAKKYAMAGKVCIVAPENTDGVSTLSRKKENLEKLYMRGYHDGESILKFLNNSGVK